jgi:predicted enzyme related to lactoylglutathione lyase
MKIALAGIHVIDPVLAFGFYTKVLGFKEHTFLPEHNLAIVVSEEDPKGTALLLEPSDNPLAKTYREGLYQSGIPVIVFGVKDVQKEYLRLKELGVVFKDEPTKTEWGTLVIFDDSCGNYVQLHQP